MARRRTGRPTALDLDVTRSVESALSAGMGRSQAAVCAGIHRSQLHRWMQRARAQREAGKDTIHTQFLDRIERAEADLMFELLRVTQGGDPVAAAAAVWILEKKWPHQFSWRGPMPEDPVTVQIIRTPLRGSAA